MSEGEDQKVSGEQGSKPESGQQGTQAGAPEDKVAALIDSAVNKAVGPLIGRVEKAEHHARVTQGSLDRMEGLIQKRDEHFEQFLTSRLKGKLADDVEPETILKEYRSERTSLDQEAELVRYKAEEEEKKAQGTIRQQAEQIVQDIGKEFGVEIPMDKLPDPVKGELSPHAFAAEVAKVTVKMLQEKPPAGEGEREQKDKGDLASLNLSPGAAQTKNPFLEKSASELVADAAAELRRKHAAEAD